MLAKGKKTKIYARVYITTLKSLHLLKLPYQRSSKSLLSISRKHAVPKVTKLQQSLTTLFSEFPIKVIIFLCL